MKTTSEVFFIWCKLGVKFKVRCRVFELFDDIIALFARSAALYTFFDHIPKKCFSIPRIYAECDPLNTRSWKLLEALGFRREAHLLQNVYFWKDEGGKPIWKDTYIYGKLAVEK